MTWVLIHTGRDISLLPGDTIEPGSITYAEVAYSLSRINRYSGHACRTYSVAEHSLLCCDIARAKGGTPEQQLCVLMHDGHEMLTGDTTSPVKMMLGEAWRTFEDGIQEKFLRSFGLYSTSQEHKSFIRMCDLIALASERAELMEYHPLRNLPWPSLDTPGAEIRPWDQAHMSTSYRIRNTPTDWAATFQRLATKLKNQLPYQQ